MPSGTLAPVVGAQPMFRNSPSPAGLSRPGTWSTPDPSNLSRFPAAADPVGTFRPTDTQLLVLLGEHEVLTTSQLVRLTGLPERTVQHRLGRLDRAGLLNRLRPQVPVGTAPYHCWLTTFGAAAISAGPPESWGQNPADMRAVAALSELWLGVSGLGTEAGLHLERWRRLPCGVPFRRSRTGTLREVPVEAELTVTLGTEMVTALVLARVEQVPPAARGGDPRPLRRLRRHPASPRVPFRCCWCWSGPNAWRARCVRRAARSPVPPSPGTSTRRPCMQRSDGSQSA